MQIATITPNGEPTGHAEVRRNMYGGLTLDGQIVLAMSVTGNRVMFMMSSTQVYVSTTDYLRVRLVPLEVSAA